MNSRIWVARNLAAAFLSAEWSPDAMQKAGLTALATKTSPKWLQWLVSEIVEETARAYPPSPDNLARMILTSEAFRGVRTSGRRRPLIGKAVTSSPRFTAAPTFRDLDVPRLTTLGALSTWLKLPIPRLDWFADVEGYRASATTEATRHYSCRWVPKKAGTPRLIEAPKPFLKGIQRQILREILDLVPVHDCVHGFRKGRSCISSAQLHAGEAIVISIDLRDFFLSIPIRSVHGLFRSLGYPWEVARYLTGLCSTETRAEEIDRLPSETRPDWRTRKLFRQQHLPQGAPTSPTLANLVAWRLDRRLDGLAKVLNARYTRYGDDLAFSGDRDIARNLDTLLHMVGVICEHSSLSVNHRKTRIMGQGSCQRLTGLVVNQHVNVPRKQYDRLKAILCNCVRHGPADQNRHRHSDFRAHLDGRITWIENVNPRRGHRLRLLFQQVNWS